MKKINYFLTLVLLVAFATINAQEVPSNGLLFPRETTATMNAYPAAAAAGIYVYNTDDSSTYKYTGTQWIMVEGAAAGSELWENVPADSLARLINLSDGVTARPAGSEVNVYDHGYVQIGHNDIDSNQNIGLTVQGEHNALSTLKGNITLNKYGYLDIKTAYNPGYNGEPRLQFLKSRGNEIATPLACLTNDLVASLQFTSYSGDILKYGKSASILIRTKSSIVDGSHNAGSMTFMTTDSVTRGLTSRLHLSETRNVGVGTTNPMVHLQVGEGNTATWLDIVATADSSTSTGVAAVSGNKAIYMYATNGKHMSSLNAYNLKNNQFEDFLITTSTNKVGLGYATSATLTSKFNILGLPIHAGGDAAAGVAGLTIGAFYHTGDGIVRVKL